MIPSDLQKLFCSQRLQIQNPTTNYKKLITLDGIKYCDDVEYLKYASNKSNISTDAIEKGK